MSKLKVDSCKNTWWWKAKQEDGEDVQEVTRIALEKQRQRLWLPTRDGYLQLVKQRVGEHFWFWNTQKKTNISRRTLRL